MPEFDDVLTIDEVAHVLRYDELGADIRDQRRRVYALVRDGHLRPIGGKPNGKMTKSLRFTATVVRRYMDGEVAA